MTREPQPGSVRAAGQGDALTSLLGRVAAGDQAALGALYDQTSRRVHGLALRILGDTGAAEEATMDVYVQVWRRADRFDPARGSADSWLLTLARSRALDLLRSRAGKRREGTSLDEVLDVAHGGPGPEEAARTEEAARGVRKALWSLPHDHRQVLEAAYFGGLSHSEIAAALGLPLGTVKTRIRSGLATLRSALAPAEEARP